MRQYGSLGWDNTRWMLFNEAHKPFHSTVIESLRVPSRELTAHEFDLEEETHPSFLYKQHVCKCLTF